MELPPNLIDVLRHLPTTTRNEVEALLALLYHLRQHPHDEVARMRVRQICRDFCRRYGPWVA